MSDIDQSDPENTGITRYDTVDSGEDIGYNREMEVRSHHGSTVSKVTENEEILQKSEEIESSPYILNIPINPSRTSTITAHLEKKDAQSIPIPQFLREETVISKKNREMQFDLSAKNFQHVMEYKINLEDRDEYKNAQYLKSNFFEIFAEPGPEFHSIACVWTLSFKIFEIVRIYCYKILSLIFGLIIACIAGFGFALFAFLNIWIIRPCFFLIRSLCSQIILIWPMFLMYIVRPSFYAIGAVFSTIRFHSTKGELIQEVWEKNVHTV